MSKMTDQKYLVTQQYKNARNLNARENLHARFSTNPRNWFDWVFDHLDLSATADILEIGCGNGDLWAHIRDRIPPGWSLVLGDLSQGMLQEAKKNLSFLGGRAKFQTLDAQLLMFDGETFDAVIANHMLYHVPNISRALLEASRVLKVGGKFFAATNGQGHMQEIHQLAIGFAPLKQQLIENNLLRNDQFSFSLENGEELLRQQFTQVKCFLYPDSLAVTQIDPLVDYLASISPEISELLSPKLSDSFRQYLEEQLEKQGGVIKITKSTGMFVAYK
jgi:ubiquinone/menaquinone biosynthesis C-methylase UbiE